MTSKTIGTIATVAKLSGAVVFMGSFFVVDNRRAVRMRWIGVSLFGAGYVVTLYKNGKLKMPVLPKI